MSVERQQGRPTAEYFTESALRFLRDEYYWVNPFKGVYEYDHSKRALDISVIWREYQADGRVPSDSFDLEFFALRQLALYHPSAKPAISMCQ